MHVGAGHGICAIDVNGEKYMEGKESSAGEVRQAARRVEVVHVGTKAKGHILASGRRRWQEVGGLRVKLQMRP